jgi:hypothetical protein
VRRSVLMREGMIFSNQDIVRPALREDAR